MPKCPRCKEIRPKESFYTPTGYRCVECGDCRERKAEAKAKRLEKAGYTPDAKAREKPRAVTARVCVVCGGLIEHADNRPRKYCSNRCYLDRRAAEVREARVANPRPEPEPRLCPECGETFVPKSGNQIVCSKECKKSRFKKVRRGEIVGKRPFGLDFDPYDGNPCWSGVPMNSTSFNPLG